MQRFFLFLLLTASFGLLANHASANGVMPGPCIAQGAPPADLASGEVFQQFTRKGAPTTAWRVKWIAQSGSGLILSDARFQRAPGEAWIQVLFEARIAELFVPYHSGSPRFEDVGYNFPLTEANADDAGACGELLGSPPSVVKEVRDRGVVWKDNANVHRGQELVLWGTLAAANYNYIIQYKLQDDGTISLDAAGTSRNLPSAELEGHMHTIVWRIDVDLDGAANDMIALSRHIEKPSQLGAADDQHSDVATEGSREKVLNEFTTVHIKDTVSKNSNGKNIGYELALVANGAARHWVAGEEYLQTDFWFTAYHPGELAPQFLPTNYVSGESLLGNDSVIWVSAPIHHEPHDEDGVFDNSGNWNGIALARWSSVTLKPHNLFATTPLFP